MLLIVLNGPLANGPFKTIKSITRVKGVGDKTLLKNEDVIVLE